MFYFILLQVWFNVHKMMQFILLQNLYYFISHETTDTISLTRHM